MPLYGKTGVILLVVAAGCSSAATLPAMPGVPVISSFTADPSSIVPGRP